MRLSRNIILCSKEDISSIVILSHKSNVLYCTFKMNNITVTLYHYLSVKKVGIHLHIKADQLTLEIL